MNNFKITNLQEQTHSKDTTTKNYVDSLFRNLTEIISNRS